MTARTARLTGTLPLLVIAAALAQGCTGSTAGQGAPAGAAAPAAAGIRHGPAHTPADAEFVRHMLAHHAQALRMAALVPERAQTERIHLLAERIDVSQRDEIARMEEWLRARGEHVPSVGMDHGAEHAGNQERAAMHARRHGTGAIPMAGMLTPDEMARLAAASGVAFDRLFLESMIRHHEGALEMVAELFGTPGAGQETEMYQLASEIDSDQRMEIDRMRGMLDTLPGA